MDEFDIQEELLKINSIHSSLNENNIMTFVILLETNRKRFNENQIIWIENRIDKLQKKEQIKINNSLEHLDIDVLTKPILQKSSEFGYITSRTSSSANGGLGVSPNAMPTAILE